MSKKKPILAAADKRVQLPEPNGTEVNAEVERPEAVPAAASPTVECTDEAGRPDARLIASENEITVDDAAPAVVPEAELPGTALVHAGAPDTQVATPDTMLLSHPAADLFPMLGDDELADLAGDIRVHGLHEPIVLHEGKVLDGRNRLAACKIANVEPRFIAWEGSGSPTTWVLSRNLHRRHLSASQRAAVAVDALPLLEAEAKERQRLAGMRTAGLRSVETEVTATLPEAPVDGGEAREKAAAAVGASARYVSDAKAIGERAPEVLDAVKSGVVTIPEAKRISALPSPAERAKAITDAKAGGGRRKQPVAKPPEEVTHAPADPLVPVRRAVGELGKLLDRVPNTDRPIWWAALRKAIRAVAR